MKKKSGKSKGFGFVEFENEGDQQKALAAINNKEIEGRELVVKVALTENPTDETHATGNSPAVGEKKPAESNTTPVSTEKPATPKTEQKK